MTKVLVVGGGPAGMMAALSAAWQGARVTLLEKKEQPGKKLRITGKGRCNLTSACARDGFIEGYPGNGKFLYSSLYEFSNQDLIAFFHNRGLETKVERGNRVFPVTDRAGDVVEVLLKSLQDAGVHVITACPVEKVKCKDGKVLGIQSPRGFLAGDAVVIATGGLSYPGTGSSGDGYVWAQAMGHHIETPRPGLVPLVCREEWVKDLQGLSLKNVKAVSFDARGTKINEEFGELLFTHFGVSGPIILTMSSDIARYLNGQGQAVQISIDLKPALSIEQLDRRLQRDFSSYSHRHFKKSLDDLLPRKLIPVIIDLSGVDPEKTTSEINKEERHHLVNLLKNLVVTVTAARPIAEAIVTAGGVDVREINPKTMQSRLVNGLYFAGEVIDVDGYTGGYNLQAAFSTGYTAGKYAVILDS